MTTGNPLAGVLDWTTRAAQDEDVGFIVESWSREAYETHKDARLSVFREQLKAYVQRRFAAGDFALVVCNQEEPHVLYGWIMWSLSGLVRFVFVKREHRRRGMAAALVNAAGLALPLHTSARLTPHAQSIKVTHKEQISYRPFTEES